MSSLSKNFEPSQIEEKWSQHWKARGYFESKPDDRPPFTVVIPPPNVTGVLHMGHTLNETVQDILVRRARMSGYNACWVPGSDHASIATESKVVQMLESERGILKRDLTREQFLGYAYEWKEKYGGIIYEQIRKLGCSVDWSRVNFTMDDHYYEAVIKVFVELYNQGLIYRGARMINWDPSARTALSDEEVEHRDVQGILYYLKYFVVDENTGKATSEYVTVATQRPETIMGDTAVCVNPNDDRYKQLAGKKVLVPLIDRAVPLIFDAYVDPEFGTGALKITPAHDINDYNIGLKHNLPVVETLNEDGTISEAAGIFVGLDRFEARTAIVKALKSANSLLREEEYHTRLGYSQRSSAVVEPRISTQWFVRMHQLAELALDPVASGEIKIHPEEKFIATYKYWLSNIKDWCISRQLWWGQRIPAWYDKEGNIYVAESEEEARKIFQHKSIDGASADLRQDDDVLDTWFSSWLWPLEVFHGITDPGNTDINYYYPTSVLVTGQDIIFFWVARMIMAGEKFRQEKPFSDVYFTGMVRDKQGRKMSKQLGNSPDLLELIHKFGADAVRFGIMISAPAGNDLLFDESSCDQGRFFNNKIWNALKLVKSWEQRVGVPAELNDDFATKWFDHRLRQARAEIEGLYKEFKLSEVLKTIYSLIWDDFCSWYLEWVKPGFEKEILSSTYQVTVAYFTELLHLLHPFMPFITEELYHQLQHRDDDLCVRQYASLQEASPSVLQTGELLKQMISGIRDVRVKNNLKPKDPVNLYLSNTDAPLMESVSPILKKQVNIENINLTDSPVEGTLNLNVNGVGLFIETQQRIDTTAQKEEIRKDLVYYQGFLNSVDKKLSNERFVQNAKPEVVEIERRKRADAEMKIAALQEALARLG